MTATLFDVDILEVLDFDPELACDQRFMGRWPTCAPDPAIWLIYMRPISSCGCPPKHSIFMTCDSCWQLACATAGCYLFCTTCKAQIARLSDYVLRIETLKK